MTRPAALGLFLSGYLTALTLFPAALHGLTPGLRLLLLLCTLAMLAGVMGLAGMFNRKEEK